APVDVPGLMRGVLAIGANGAFTCAVTLNGGVKCWGNNDFGSLGDNTITSRQVPVDVVGPGGVGRLSGAVAIAAGGYHACALAATGALQCWGDNAYGEVGDGSTTNRLAPVAVSGLSSGVIAVSAGDLHTCALIVGGGAKCWGAGSFGELGDGAGLNRSTPVDVPGLTSGVAAVSAGEKYTCALAFGGGAKCWGTNAYGQLGDNSITDRYAPVDVLKLTTDKVVVVAGYSDTCIHVAG